MQRDLCIIERNNRDKDNRKREYKDGDGGGLELEGYLGRLIVGRLIEENRIIEEE
jgi:hypothetical protein